MNKLLYVIIGVLIIFNSMNAQRNYKIYDTKTKSEINIDKLIEFSKNYDVIFFGEFHDDSLVHYLEKSFLEAMFDRYDNSLVVSMEMFERDNQEIIDKYLKGKIPDSTFEKECRLWSNYQTDYKPLINLIKENNSYLIAANIPRKYASMFAKSGLSFINKIESSERNFIAQKFKFDMGKYQIKFYKTMLSTFGKDKIEELTPNEENTVFLFYGAQVLKDETMAESIANYLERNKGKKVIHFNGSFHSEEGLGTVEKLKDQNPNLKVAVITPVYFEENEKLEYKDEYTNLGEFILGLEPMEHEEYPDLMSSHMGGNYVKSHNIEIKIDPEKNFLEGSDIIQFSNPIIKSASLKLIKDLNIKYIKSNDCDLQWKVNKSEFGQEIIINPTNNREIHTFEVAYEGKVYNPPNQRNLKQKHAFSMGIISNKEGEGIYLPAGSYYPYTEDDLADFKIKMIHPSDLILITSGKQVSISELENSKTVVYQSELPADNLTIVGGRYTVKDTVYDNIRFAIYLLNDNNYKDKYLNAIIDYYKFYTELFGKYPYSSFSLVENFFATGFGMPGYTLISGLLIKMPWVLLSPGSLAHEFVHNWWGNSVYIKDDNNWCEGLTTFSANYYYNELIKNENGAIDWRKKALISIYDLPEDNNYPLKDFKYQENTDDAVIGYSKGGFLFYELYKIMGKEHFFNALKEFYNKYSGKRASWFSLQFLFSNYTRKNNLDIPISDIFYQWLNKKNIPLFKIQNVKHNANKFTVEIIQDDNFYTLLPLQINTDLDTTEYLIKIDKDTTIFEFQSENDVQSIKLDPEFKTFRKLYYWEIPYTFNRILNSKPLIILPKKDEEQYEIAIAFAKELKESRYNNDYISCDDISKEQWIDRPLIILGNPEINSFFDQIKNFYPENISLEDDELIIEDETFDLDNNLLMINYSHPTNKSLPTTIIAYTELDDVEQLRRLFHYMSYSMLLIDKVKREKPLFNKELFPKTPNVNPLIWQK